MDEGPRASETYPPAPREVVREAILAALPQPTTTRLVKTVEREVWGKRLHLRYATIIAEAYALHAEGKLRITRGRRRGRRFERVEG